MRWIERLWRDDQRVKATPGRVAASLSDGVIRSTNLLRIRLLKRHSLTPIASASRARPASRVPAVRVVPPRHRRRRGVRAHPSRSNRRWSAAHAGPRSKRTLPGVLLDFARLHRERFAEYRETSGGDFAAGPGAACLAADRGHGRAERSDDDVPGDARHAELQALRGREAVHPHHASRATNTDLDAANPV